MAAAIQNTSTLIDQNWLDGNKNEQAGWTFFRRLTKYTNTTVGAVRAAQVIKDSAKLRNEMGMQHSSAAATIQSGAATALSVLGVIYIPSITRDAINKVADLSKDTGVPAERKMGQALMTVMEAISTWVYSFIFLTGNAAPLSVARFANLTCDGADLSFSVADYRKALQCEDAASGNVKAVFTHSKNFYMLCIIKAVLSAVSAILVVTLFLTGAKLLPTAAVIILSLAAALFAIRRDLHKNEGQYPVINFDRPVIV